jgi:DNA-binding transcriptional MerR regulator
MLDSSLSDTATGTPSPISMRIVMQRSGVLRQTIHFYLRKGLLPKPRRTSRTYALYSPETLDLLEIIKDCQARLRLSLDEIMKIFVHANYDPRKIRTDLERRKPLGAPPAGTGGGGETSAADDLIASLRPPPPQGWLDELHRLGLVAAAPGKYAPETADLIRSIWDLCQLGAELDQLQKLVPVIGHEAEALLAVFRSTVESARHPVTDYTKASRLLAAFDQFAGYKRKDSLREAFFNKAFRPAERVVGPQQKRVIPSETFLVKMGLNREIDRLQHVLDRDPTDKKSLQELARAYHMRSDWLTLYSVNARILQLDPLHVRAMADQTRAMYYLGRIDEAIALLEHRVQTNSDPLLKFRLGQALLLRAQNAGIAELNSAIIRRDLLTTEALREAKDIPSVRRWILLDRALDNLSIADPFKLNQPTVEEMEALYQEYQAIPDKSLTLLSRLGLAIGRALAAYALYQVYRRDNHPKAEQLRRKIVQMDPHCVIAGRSGDTRVHKTQLARVSRSS